MNKLKLPMRDGVGVIILNKKNEVFVGKRKDNPINKWQMPQGGVNYGEKLIDAMKRELEEETGIKQKKIILISETKKWINYDLPKELVPKLWGGKYDGQKQKWFAMKFLGINSDININTKHPEFSNWKWMTKERLLEHIVPFKREVYKKVLSQFSSIIELN